MVTKVEVRVIELEIMLLRAARDSCLMFAQPSLIQQYRRLYRAVVDKVVGRVRWAKEEWTEVFMELKLRGTRENKINLELKGKHF